MNARFLKSAKNQKNVKNLIGHDPISCQFFVRAYSCGHFDTLCAGKAIKMRILGPFWSIDARIWSVWKLNILPWDHIEELKWPKISFFAYQSLYNVHDLLNVVISKCFVKFLTIFKAFLCKKSLKIVIFTEKVLEKACSIIPKHPPREAPLVYPPPPPLFIQNKELKRLKWLTITFLTYEWHLYLKKASGFITFTDF